MPSTFQWLFKDFWHVTHQSVASYCSTKVAGEKSTARGDVE